MEKQKAVVPTVYEFRVPKEVKPDRLAGERKVISGVAITNKIPPKQGAAKPVEPPADSSFLIQNVRKPSEPALLPVAPLSPSEDSEDQGFPYDDQADVLFGSPRGTVRKAKVETKAESPIRLPVSEDPILAIRSQARAKVRNWVESKAAQRALQLQHDLQGYKNPGLRYQLRCNSARNSGVRQSVARMKKACEGGREEDRSDEVRAAEAHIKRVYSAVPRTSSHPGALLHDREADTRGISQLSPAIIDFLHDQPPEPHPWIPSSVQGLDSPDSSFEEVPYQ